jgi:hypothetical protein
MLSHIRPSDFDKSAAGAEIMDLAALSVDLRSVMSQWPEGWSMICYKSEIWRQSVEKERCGKCRRKPPPNRRKRLGINPSAQTRTMTIIDYKGYRIEVRAVGKGWRASIFSPGSTSPWPNSPANLEKSSTEEIVAEAKRIIEMRLGPRLL